MNVLFSQYLEPLSAMIFLLDASQVALIASERVEIAPFWELVSVMIALGILAGLKRIFNKKLVQYANALISKRFIGQLTREERSSESMSVVLLEIFHFIVIALFANLAYLYVNPLFLLEGFEGFAFFFMIFLIFHLIKVFINNLLGWLLEMPIAFNDFSFFNFLTHGATGVLLFPIVVLLLFSHLSSFALLGTGALIIAILYLYRISRLALRFWWEKSFRLKYFILYICGLEILPVLVLVKFAHNSL